MAMHALRALLASRLDPLDFDGLSERTGSDADLNPQLDLSLSATPIRAAVLIALVDQAEGLQVLLTRRADSLRRHAGQIALPGGLCDPGETILQTALREAHEEIGLEPRFVRPIGLSTPFRTLTGYCITPVVAFVEPGYAIQANADEVAEVFETPFAYLMDAANHQRELRDLPLGPRRWVYSITHGERVILGITAAMVRELSERLGGGETT